jgi:integrase
MPDVCSPEALQRGLGRHADQRAEKLHVLPLLPKTAIATASFAGLREGELRGLEWPYFAGDSLTVNRSIWKTVVNRPKTRAGAQAVPVIRQLAEILNAYRLSMGNPQSGVMFHSRAVLHMDFDKLGQSIIRPAVEALRLNWYGWHGFRRGIASNLYELGAPNDKVASASYGMQSHT